VTGKNKNQSIERDVQHNGRKRYKEVDKKRAYFYLITLYQKIALSLSVRKLLSMVLPNSNWGGGGECMYKSQ
jgi:hypothetical protein